MPVLENHRVTMEFDNQARLCSIRDGGDRERIPIDREALTCPFQLQLRDGTGDITSVQPQEEPDLAADGNSLTATWRMAAAEGSLDVKATIRLPQDTCLAEWTLDVDNHTDCALWQIDYPRVSGLTAFKRAFPELQGPDWVIEPKGMGGKIPDPVNFVNRHKMVIDEVTREEYGNLGVDENTGDIAYSYPGMWCLQFMAYGHPDTGGLYFGIHDGQALFKAFGFYADGDDPEHAAFILKQYPENRTARGADFASTFPVAVGPYNGEWWNAAFLYRAWALDQVWCARGPTRDRDDIPAWLKQLDLWYWNHTFAKAGHPRLVFPIIERIKEAFDCNVAFHWYGASDQNFDSYWNYPDVYPYCPDVRRALIAGMKKFRELGVRCIPYINARIWNPETESYRIAGGDDWITVDEHGQSNGAWGQIGQTACPTAEPHHRLIRDITNRMIDEIGMDGAYLDQISSAYSLPCFNPNHDHAPGGHDHWCRGYRALLEDVQQDIKTRSPDNVITSESTIECYQDLLDADLARETTNLKSVIGGPDYLPIPLYNSVYHDYHIIYGSVSKFTEKNLEKFRFAEALCLVSGNQLMIGGTFAGDEDKETLRPHFEYMETMTRARKAARRFFNLGEWTPPMALACDRVDVHWSDEHPPKRDIPAILNGAFAIDGELCVVFVNFTDAERSATFEWKPEDYGLGSGNVNVRSVYPGSGAVADGQLCLPAHSAAVWIVSRTEPSQKGGAS